MNYRLTSLVISIASFLYFPLANASEIINPPLNNKSKSISTENNGNFCSINEIQANEEIEQLKADIQTLILVKTNIESQIAKLSSEKTDSQSEQSEVERLEFEVSELIKRRDGLYEEKKSQVDELNKLTVSQYKKQKIIEIEKENGRLNQRSKELSIKALEIIGGGFPTKEIDDGILKKSSKTLENLIKRINPWITAVDIASKMRQLSDIQQEYNQIQKQIDDNNNFIKANFENTPEHPEDLLILINSRREAVTNVENSIEDLIDKIEYKQTLIERERAREVTIVTDNQSNADTERINTLNQKLKQIEQNISYKEKQIEKLELLYGNKTCDFSNQEAFQSSSSEILGNWLGSINQGGYSGYSGEFSFSMARDEIIGISRYPELNCEGELTLLSVKDNQYSFQETITNGISNCISGLTKTFLVISPTTIKYSNNRYNITANLKKTDKSELPALASANQKYSNLIQVLNCPNDRSQHDEFDDYGYWSGGSWCGQTGKAGYWVWVYPNWYIWQEQR